MRGGKDTQEKIYKTYKPYPISFDSDEIDYCPNADNKTETQATTENENRFFEDFPELSGDRFALGDTVGKLANIVSEVGELDRLDEGHLKAFVSGDRITIDRKYKEPICVQPTARLMLATNTPPRVSDRSQGLWRRILYLPFEVTIPTERQNPRLAEELLAELPGIFNWALLGLARLREQGRFTEPAACSRAVQEYRIDCDPVREILSESNQALTQTARVEAIQRPDPWDIADNLLELGIGIGGVVGGAFGVRMVRKLQLAREKSIALREIVKGNELFKRDNPEDERIRVPCFFVKFTC